IDPEGGKLPMRQKKARAVRAVEILCASAGVAAAYAHAAAQVPVPLQPFAQQVRQIETALKYLGQPLSPAEQSQINAAIANPDEAAAVAGIERILDHYTLAVVDINPESRVKVAPGPAKAELVEAGTRIFLVKVRNQAGVTSRLMVESPNSGPVYIRSDSSPQPPVKLTAAEAEERWADISLYDKDPLPERLSGLALEYRISKSTAATAVSAPPRSVSTSGKARRTSGSGAIASCCLMRCRRARCGCACAMR